MSTLVHGLLETRRQEAPRLPTRRLVVKEARAHQAARRATRNESASRRT
jgi:hypothetical protein